MVGRVRRVLELIRALRPADVAPLEDAQRDVAMLATVYDRLRAWNFSHDFLACIPEHLAVTRADDLGWSHWGTPEAIERSLGAMGLVPPWRRMPRYGALRDQAAGGSRHRDAIERRHRVVR